MSKEAKILIAISVIVIGLGVAFAFLSKPSETLSEKNMDSSKIVKSSSHSKGNKDAKVTLVEFGDYQCPACGQAYPQVKMVEEKYKNNPDFNFVFRNLPLTSIHPNAQISAEAAEAAGDQGKYWEMYAKLYENQKEWVESKDPIPVFTNYAKAIDLNEDVFKQALDSHKFASVVAADRSDAESLGLNSTPSFFINGKLYTGNYNASSLERAIDEELQQ